MFNPFELGLKAMDQFPMPIDNIKVDMEFCFKEFL